MGDDLVSAGQTAQDDRTSPATWQLMEFATGTRFEDLPDAVVHESKRCILDTLGVAIGAADDDAPTLALAEVRELGGTAQATVLVHGDRTNVVNAALVNGVMAHVFDFDDTHIPTILHPSGPILAAGLPMAEWLAGSGRDLLAAHAIAYEVSARASLALYPDHYDVGWHMTGTTGTLGGMTAAARILRLDPAQMVHALGIAATQASGHREHFGTMTKSFHVGKAAANGVLAALLARRGYTAAPDGLEGRRGMFSVMAATSRSDELVAELGSSWEIFHNGIKPYSCGVVTHPGIDAVRRLGPEHGIRAEDVESIELRVHPLVLELTSKPEPRTGLEGKFSIAFASAIALIDGTARPRQFTDENVHRPDVVDLRDRIHPTPDDSLTHEQATALVRLRDGGELTLPVSAATGTPENPISDAELHEKFHDLVDPVLGRPGAEQLAAAVDDLHRAKSLEALVNATVRRAE